MQFLQPGLSLFAGCSSWLNPRADPVVAAAFSQITDIKLFQRGPYPQRVFRLHITSNQKSQARLDGRMNKRNGSLFRLSLDYSVESLESRAVARALIEDRDKSGRSIHIVFVSSDGKRSNGPKLKIQR
jgi:hypothetical protein